MAGELGEAAGEIGSALSELADAAERIRDFRSSLDFSPDEYDAIESRLAQLRRLEKRYSTDEAGLIAGLERARAEYESLENSRGAARRIGFGSLQNAKRRRIMRLRICHINAVKRQRGSRSAYSPGSAS